jgi:hypothetical protein
VGLVTLIEGSLRRQHFEEKKLCETVLDFKLLLAFLHCLKANKSTYDMLMIFFSKTGVQFLLSGFVRLKQFKKRAQPTDPKTHLEKSGFDSSN